MKVKSFEELSVWQEAHHLTLEVYAITVKFPANEKYGIVSQLRRSSSAAPRISLRDLAEQRRGNSYDVCKLLVANWKKLDISRS